MAAKTDSKTALAVAESKKQQAPSVDLDLEGSSFYLNRELSWLEFNRRVLQEALIPAGHPLLERVKFLAIFHSNLDEFFMIRVSGLKQQVQAGAVKAPPDGMLPAEQLVAIRRRLLPMLEQGTATWQNDLKPKLCDAGIRIHPYEDLSSAQRTWLSEYFLREVFPVLTPLVFDPGHPFPHISNLSVNLAVKLIDPPSGDVHYGRIKVPATLPRLIELPRELFEKPADEGKRRSKSNGRGPDLLLSSPGEHDYVWLEQVVAANIASLYQGVEIKEVYTFRVTRDADLEIQEDEADDLLRTIEQGIRLRRFGPVVRLEIEKAMPAHMRSLLMHNLQVAPDDVYEMELPLGMSSLMALMDVDRHDLKDKPFIPRMPAALSSGESIFAAIRRGDILLHHPYDSFTPVVDFIKRAADDPQVLAIKQTLYRVGSNSPIVEALMRARENGKQVAVLVELKARFDEENNIVWARALERAGVHVVYGLLGLKTHCKVALVVRREHDVVRRYVHLGTGNYNAITARIYTDLGMFTCRPDIAADASELFNFLTGYSKQRTYRDLLVAPVTLRSSLASLLRREIAHKKAGRPARVIIKMNALTDKDLIHLLYEASQAGVEIDLLVRGICCLRPAVPGVSETIRVTSIVGRFLEHTRIFYFANGGDEEIYSGSADMMERNLDRRVEVLFPVQDPALRQHIYDDILATYLADNVKNRLLKPDGTYEMVSNDGGPRINSQQWLLEHASGHP
ncbi:MAG: polyphosphate kinase 1 [Anaerolineae bacterium]|nr:polyphosphate kinase 1 [Anaerolineae bacterium]